jgi:hypothetical protein
MKTGAKVIISTVTIAGIGVLVWLMFFKKDSKLYVLKPKSEDDQNGEEEEDDTKTPDDTNGGGYSGGYTPPASTPCPYPSTPFKNRSEGNDFRKWVNDNYSSIAKKIDGGTGKKDGLDRTGSYDNCYIREAYQYKTDGGRTLGNLYQGTINSETTPPPTTDAWDRFVQRLDDQGIDYSMQSGNNMVKILLHSDDHSSMKSTYYNLVYDRNGFWALAYRQSTSGSFTNIAGGTYNLGDLKAGTKIKVTRVDSTAPMTAGDLNVGYQVTANNKILYPIQMVIYRFWSGWGMTKSMAQTIKSIDW